MGNKGQTYEEYWGKEKAQKQKEIRRLKALKQHQEGRSKLPSACPICKTWMSDKKIHNCKEIKEKMRLSRLKNPLRPWLGKKRPEFGLLMKKLFTGKTLEEKCGVEKAKIIREKLKLHAKSNIANTNNKFGKTHNNYWNKGLTKFTDERVAKQGKHNSDVMKEKWKDEEYAKEQFKALRKKPSSYEKKVIEIISKYNLPYKYTGNFTFWINGKNPDFVNVNGEKICVEVYNTINKTVFNKLSIEEYKISREKVFGEYGWKVVFIDENDLEDENIIVSKLKY